MQTIWLDPKDHGTVWIIDQRALPHQLEHEALTTYQDAARAIREMHVRGAPLIGATAAWGLYLAVRQYDKQKDFAAYLQDVIAQLQQTRPTAVDLFYALEQASKTILNAPAEERIDAARKAAERFARESAAQCRAIGEHGLPLVEAIAAQKPGQPVNILTHCNAGKLACLDYGTATAPIYLAHEKGIPVHVWVDETRPRNQGARLTAFELAEAGIPHTVIVDNLGGHLMQHGMVDIVFVGTDRTTRTGDVANKIGTYLKALAAHDNQIPFYVGLPTSTIDWSIRDGLTEIPIEERGGEEVTHIYGYDDAPRHVRLTPENSPGLNYGFDVTPARYVTGLITERGVCDASEEGLLGLFPEEKK